MTSCKTPDFFLGPIKTQLQWFENIMILLELVMKLKSWCAGSNFKICNRYTEALFLRKINKHIIFHQKNQTTAKWCKHTTLYKIELLKKLSKYEKLRKVNKNVDKKHKRQNKSKTKRKNPWTNKYKTKQNEKRKINEKKSPLF